MLKPVRQGEELNEQNLKSFLIANKLIETAEAPLKISQFSNGFSNLTYLLEVADKQFVLRKPPKGAVKRGHDMSREYKVLSKLENNFSKSPKVFAYCNDAEVVGSSFYLMEKVEGIILTTKEAQKRNLTTDQYKNVAATWLTAFVDLHYLNYNEIGLNDLGKPKGYVKRQVVNWGKQYLKAATTKIDEAEKVMSWMEFNQPQQYDFCLIHNDFKYDNVVFTNENYNNINAILDWEMCTLGDPLMDLGTSLAYWLKDSDGPINMFFPSPTSFAGNPSRMEIAEQYANQSGRNTSNILFYYVYGLFKVAVIAQQIFYRYHKGLTTNEKFKHLDEMCMHLCKMASTAIEKKKIEDYL